MAQRIENWLEQLIFASRWLQAPLYVGLIVASAIYAYKFLVELVHLIIHVQEFSEATVMLSVLTLVDITMVANLIAVTVIGGYSTFVSRLDIDNHPDRPDWLRKVDAGTLKVTLAASLVGVSGIHLLKSFININNRNHEDVKWQIIIHVVFLFSSFMLAATECLIHRRKGKNN